MGVKKYGTHLEFFNGRNPAVDAYQEVFDALLYTRQTMFQYGFLIEFIESVIEELGMEWHDERWGMLRSVWEGLGKKAGKSGTND